MNTESAANPISGAPWEVCSTSAKIAAFAPPLTWYKDNANTAATYTKTTGPCRAGGENVDSALLSRDPGVDLNVKNT